MGRPKLAPCKAVEDGVVCGGDHFGLGYCRKHHARFKRSGDTVKRDNFGKTAWNKGIWRDGENPTYATVHSWLRINLGPAKHQKCTKCDSVANCWAFDNQEPYLIDNKCGPYYPDLTRYSPLCHTHHGQQDKSTEICFRGHVRTEENTYVNGLRRECKECWKARS